MVMMHKNLFYYLGFFDEVDLGNQQPRYYQLWLRRTLQQQQFYKQAL